jgi:benzoyl-CoA reductase/2-hydroxyglutaryl-CoA dehydratase subunit BcrC/BadD/HgdB
MMIAELIRGKTLDKISERNIDRKAIGCFPLYPPLELFHSLGLVPVTLWGLKDSIPTTGESDRHLQPYACSVARHLMEFLLSENGAALGGLFMYNACDTLRNLPEIINCGLADAGRSLPIFKIHLPMVPREQTESRDYLRARIKMLINELENAYQVTFSIEKFRQSVSLYREIRKLCKALETLVANGRMSYNEFSRIIRDGWFVPAEDQLLALQKILQDRPLSKREHVPSARQSRIVVSGILPPPPYMIQVFENAGLTFVGNDIASQNRSLFYTPAMVHDPADYYVDFYNHHYPCTTLLYTADRRVAAIRELILSTRAQGVVFIGEKFCEFEYFEIPHLEKILKDMGVPTLFLEVSIDDNEYSEAYVTRIETFAELIGSANQGGRYAE